MSLGHGHSCLDEWCEVGDKVQAEVAMRMLWGGMIFTQCICICMFHVRLLLFYVIDLAHCHSHAASPTMSSRDADCRCSVRVVGHDWSIGSTLLQVAVDKDYLYSIVVSDQNRHWFAVAC